MFSFVDGHLKMMTTQTSGPWACSYCTWAWDMSGGPEIISIHVQEHILEELKNLYMNMGQSGIFAELQNCRFALDEIYMRLGNIR